MFTGIIQAVGTVRSLRNQGEDLRLTIDTGKLSLQEVALGESIAVNGVCLTVVAIQGDQFQADVSQETLSCTTLGKLHPGSQVNLERALTLATPLGGHLVSGHVDGLGTILSRTQAGRSQRFRVQAPEALARYIAPKGSICVDGVSLTVNEVSGSVFSLNLVPHTLQETLFETYQPGDWVNLEVDLIARYLERLLLGPREEQNSARPISAEFLKQHGFLK